MWFEFIAHEPTLACGSVDSIFFFLDGAIAGALVRSALALYIVLCPSASAFSCLMLWCGVPSCQVCRPSKVRLSVFGKVAMKVDALISGGEAYRASLLRYRSTCCLGMRSVD